MPYRGPNVKKSGTVILDPHPDSDQHQNLTTSRTSPLAMSTMFGIRARELSCSQNDSDTMTDKHHRSHDLRLAGGGSGHFPLDIFPPDISPGNFSRPDNSPVHFYTV